MVIASDKGTINYENSEKVTTDNYENSEKVTTITIKVIIMITILL